jgi:hypothetical protein
MTALSRADRPAPGAVVRKPPEKEPAECGWRRGRPRYGDFDAGFEHVAGDDAACGAIGKRRGDGNVAWEAWRQEPDADPSLKGTPPAELRFERAVKFDIVVNLRSAKKLGTELPIPILLRAKEVIEWDRASAHAICCTCS